MFLPLQELFDSLSVDSEASATPAASETVSEEVKQKAEEYKHQGIITLDQDRENTLLFFCLMTISYCVQFLTRVFHYTQFRQHSFEIK